MTQKLETKIQERSRGVKANMQKNFRRPEVNIKEVKDMQASIGRNIQESSKATSAKLLEIPDVIIQGEDNMGMTDHEKKVNGIDN